MLPSSSRTERSAMRKRSPQLSTSNTPPSLGTKPISTLECSTGSFLSWHQRISTTPLTASRRSSRPAATLEPSALMAYAFSFCRTWGPKFSHTLLHSSTIPSTISAFLQFGILYSTPLRLERNTKILGSGYDTMFSFGEHVNDVRKKVRKRNNY